MRNDLKRKDKPELKRLLLEVEQIFSCLEDGKKVRWCCERLMQMVSLAAAVRPVVVHLLLLCERAPNARQTGLVCSGRPVTQYAHCLPATDNVLRIVSTARPRPRPRPLASLRSF